jgi:putative membrane protein
LTQGLSQLSDGLTLKNVSDIEKLEGGLELLNQNLQNYKTAVTAHLPPEIAQDLANIATSLQTMSNEAKAEQEEKMAKLVATDAYQSDGCRKSNTYQLNSTKCCIKHPKY